MTSIIIIYSYFDKGHDLLLCPGSWQLPQWRGFFAGGGWPGSAGRATGAGGAGSIPSGLGHTMSLTSGRQNSRIFS